MWTTIVMQLRVNIWRPATLFWVLAFPIILATLFFFMFGGLEHADDFSPLSVAVVRDVAWQASGQGDVLLNQLETTSESDDPADSEDSADSAALITAHDVTDVEAARHLLKQGDAVAYLYENEQGKVAMAVADTIASTSDSSAQVTLSALRLVLTRFNETGALVSDIASQNPAALSDPTLSASIGMSGTFTKEVTLTHFKPNLAARYYFALLGMACLQALDIGIRAITDAQANLSPLGARRTLAPLPKRQLLTATFLSSWFVSFACMLLAFLVIRYVFNVEVGGRETAAVVGVAVATFMATALGTMLGAIPIPLGVKIGISVAFTTILPLFAGLYGQQSMELGDAIARNAPVLAGLNPVRQFATLFYDILFYDSFAPFMRTTGVLAAMSAVFLVIAIVLLRRQRYEHL